LRLHPHAQLEIRSYAQVMAQIAKVICPMAYEAFQEHVLHSVRLSHKESCALKEIFKAHPECFDLQTQEFVRTDRHRAALGFDRLVYTRSVEESKALNDRKDPMVIISASGMAEAGRILHHLKNNIEDKRNAVLIVGWQAPDTLGRRIAEREKQVKIFDEFYEVRAEISTIGGLSAHAGQNMLLEYAQAVKESAKSIYLVHGETGPAETLRGLLRERKMEQVYYPELHSSVEI
jgi:metallo-beta-lactamase family protein